MIKEKLKDLAKNPNFIQGIYNYCDRLCEGGQIFTFIFLKNIQHLFVHSKLLMKVLNPFLKIKFQ